MNLSTQLHYDYGTGDWMIFFEDIQDGAVRSATADERGNLTLTPVSPSERREPALRIPRHCVDWLRQLAAQLAVNKIASPDSTADGELKATKVHLEDMRKLTFQAYTKVYEVKT